MYHDLLPIKKQNLPNAHDSSGNFFDLLDQGDPQPDADVPTLQGIVRMHGDVHNSNFSRRGPEKYHETDRVLAEMVAVEGKQSLRVMAPDKDR